MDDIATLYTYMWEYHVLADRVGEFDSCPPALPIENFDLEACPEGLDDGIVIGVAD